MNAKVMRPLLFLPIVFAFLFGECATFQSPKVLEKGEQSLTVGGALLIVEWAPRWRGEGFKTCDCTMSR